MSGASTKRIEEAATTALKAALLRCPILESYIDSNDKTPSWDGTVFVYNSDNTKKENLLGRVPIQVKGTQNVIVSDIASYACSVADLDNYYRDGGCVFFLVSVDLTDGTSKIFYNSLLVYDLDKIIKKAKKKDTVTIHLSRFPSDLNEISNIFLTFVDNAPKQAAFIGKDFPTLDSLKDNGLIIDSLTFTAHGLGSVTDNIPKYLSTHNFYLYAKVKGLGMEIPIDKITNAIISRPVNGEVKVKGHCFFPSYKVIYEDGKPTIHVGKGITIDFSSEKGRITIHTNRPDTLSDCILETELFLEIAEQGEVTLNGVTLPLHGIELADLQERKKALAYFKDVKRMLDYLGVSEELCLSSLNDKDENNLRNFTGTVLYNREIGFPNMVQDQLCMSFKIGNLAIWIWATRQADGMYRIDNFFNHHQVAMFRHDDVGLKNPIPSSQFLAFDKQSLLHISNMNYERVYQDISQTELSLEYCSKVNFLILDMISAYDEQKQGDKKLLELAEKICDWLISVDSKIDDEVLLLNKYQIVKRKRALSPSEMIEIARLADDKNAPTIKCGAYLLLDAAELAQKDFDKLTVAEQIEFLTYPICYFGTLTIKEETSNG